MKKKIIKKKAISYTPARHINLGKYLLDLRYHHNMTVKKITDLTGIPHSTFATAELGKGQFSPLYFKKLAEEFTISADLMGKLKTINLKQATGHIVNRRYEPIGQHVRDVRRANKISMETCAAKLNVPYSTIAHIEYSEAVFSKDLLNRFIRLLKLPRCQSIKLRENNARLAEHLAKYPRPKRAVWDKRPYDIKVDKEDTIHSKFLKQLRKEKNLSQNGLVNFLGDTFTQSGITHVENNKGRLTITKVKFLKKKLKLSETTYKKLLKFCIRE